MVQRRPRPKCTQRKQKFLEDPHFPQVAQELRPVLFKVANGIKRPYYIDNSDLVQEALLHIFLNRDKYSEELSSIMTWSQTVAKRKFMNIAANGFRDKRCPKDSDKKALNPIDYEELLYFADNDGGCLSSCVTHNSVEDDIHERELVGFARKRLRGFARTLFDTYINPPEELITLVNQRMRAQQARIRRVKKQNKVNDTPKQPFSFHIDNKTLSTYFKVPIHKVVRAKDSIRGELRKASTECGGDWPTNCP